MKSEKLRIVRNERAADEFVIQCLRDHAQAHGRLDVLEAGCGRRWPYDLDEFDMHLTGIDVDEEALRIRATKLPAGSSLTQETRDALASLRAQTV